MAWSVPSTRRCYQEAAQANDGPEDAERLSQRGASRRRRWRLCTAPRADDSVMAVFVNNMCVFVLSWSVRECASASLDFYLVGVARVPHASFVCQVEIMSRNPHPNVVLFLVSCVYVCSELFVPKSAHTHALSYTHLPGCVHSTRQNGDGVRADQAWLC